MDLNNNQEIKAEPGTHGGARPGAGRKPGSVTKLKIRDYVSQDQVDELVELLIKKVKEGDPVLMKFLVEQLFGKAAQSLDLTSGEEKLGVMLVEIIGKQKKDGDSQPQDQVPGGVSGAHNA